MRVCELAEISEAQRREINETQARPIPTFQASADRQCATG